jgi:hypothetical protein
MPTSYRLSCGAAMPPFTLTSIDERILRVVLAHAFPEPPAPERFGVAEIEAYREKVILLRRIFFWANSDKPRMVPRDKLLEETTVALRELDRDSNHVMYLYSTTASFVFKRNENDEGIPIQGSGTGSIGGIRIGGDQSCSYMLHADIGICDLKKLETDELGRGHFTSTVDLRSEKTLATDNMGEITIKRRKIKSDLPNHLRHMAQFLSAAQGEEIEIDSTSKKQP